MDNTTGRIKGLLWEVVFFPKPEKFRLRAQTFGSLFGNNKSSGSWYQIKAPKLNSPEEEVAWDQQIPVCLFFFHLEAKKRELKSGGCESGWLCEPGGDGVLGAPGRGGRKYLVDMTMEAAWQPVKCGSPGKCTSPTRSTHACRRAHTRVHAYRCPHAHRHMYTYTGVHMHTDTHVRAYRCPCARRHTRVCAYRCPRSCRHTCECVQVSTHVDTHLHACMHVYTSPHTHADTCTHTHTARSSCPQAPRNGIHACVQTGTLDQRHICVHAHMHACTHTCTHAHRLRATTGRGIGRRCHLRCHQGNQRWGT